MSDSRSDIRAGGDLPARLEEEPPELPASYRRPGRDGDVPQPDNELFRLLVESAADYAIFALDPDGFVLSWNRGGERIKGYAAKEIIGKHFSIFYTDEAKSTGFPAYELEVTKREGRFVDEGWRVRKDGTQFWARVVISALRNASGEFIGLAKVTQDLTSRRESEQQARQLAAEAAAHKEAQLRSAELLALN